MNRLYYFVGLKKIVILQYNKLSFKFIQTIARAIRDEQPLFLFNSYLFAESICYFFSRYK